MILQKEKTEQEAILNIKKCLKEMSSINVFDRFMDFEAIFREIYANLLQLLKITEKTDTLRYEKYGRALSDMFYIGEHEVKFAKYDATIKEKKKTFGKYFNNYKKSLDRAKIQIELALSAITNDQTIERQKDNYS